MDIDEKIADSWEEKLAGSYTPKEYSLVRKAYRDIAIFIDQLKECREKNRRLLILMADNSVIIKKAVEQHIKERVKYEGWEFVCKQFGQKWNSEMPLKDIMALRVKFEQAIESAGVIK